MRLSFWRIKTTAVCRRYYNHVHQFMAKFEMCHLCMHLFQYFSGRWIPRNLLFSCVIVSTYAATDRWNLLVHTPGYESYTTRVVSYQVWKRNTRWDRFEIDLNKPTSRGALGHFMFYTTERISCSAAWLCVQVWARHDKSKKQGSITIYD